MKVKAIPKKSAENMKDHFRLNLNTAIISILDHDVTRIFDNNNRSLTVWFDDIHPTTTNTLHSCLDCKAMSVFDAIDIIQFIKQLPSDVDIIVVHCTAGICRSGAVIDFLRVILDVDDTEFATMNSHIIPNTWVRDLLWSTWTHNYKY